MSRLYLNDPKHDDTKIQSVIERFVRKVQSIPPGICPLVVQQSFLETSMNQTCGKCVPCRDGLPQLYALLETVLDGSATLETLDAMRQLATLIRDGSDCAIGYDSAAEFLRGLDDFQAEYLHHIEKKACADTVEQKVPCINMCPAHVDIPGYIALTGEGDYAGAINLIRKDNPLPTACAMICEHPCEVRCRRRLLDDALNIRGIKKFAVDQIPADQVPVPKAGKPTGKSVAIIGGGPAGLTAAFYLGLMGHKVVIFERQKALGGMLRYGIPNYRFPKDRLDEDIRAILSAGDIEVRYETKIGEDITIQEIHDQFDAMFVAIGAQKGKKLRLDNVDAGNVSSAVDMLDKIGNGDIPDYRGKTVAVIGGGNVAMDAARSSIRCGADAVSIVYRRRMEDMTALDTEIEAAAMERIELMTLMAPKSIEVDENNNCSALIVQPQMISTYDKAGRPRPIDAAKDPVRLDCDIILIAVGQDIESAPFEEFGMQADRGVFFAGLDTSVEGMPGVFVGGDCATGPATAIKAIAGGKVAAANIDEYLGFRHIVPCEAEAPVPKENNRQLTGRVNITERPAYLRMKDFEHVENALTLEEALQEAGRCLRCDHFGCGVLDGGRDF